MKHKEKHFKHSEERRWQLEQELEESGRLLRQAYDGFNRVSDPDLVDAWIYEINARQSQYSYLLRVRKGLEGEEVGRR